MIYAARFWYMSEICVAGDARLGIVRRPLLLLLIELLFLYSVLDFSRGSARVYVDYHIKW